MNLSDNETKFVKVQPLRHEGTKKRNMKFKLLSKREASISEKIVDAAFTVHKVLGRAKHLGFLINFNVPLIKNGINRIIL
jgi:hypothetical protein